MMDVMSDLNPPDVVILANGDPPKGAARVLLDTAKICVACDGAVRVARLLGREPDFVVGDGDSISTEDSLALDARFVRVAEQETNDLAKAFRFSCGRFPSAGRLVILGASGGREDHFIGNISRLAGFAEEWARTPGRPVGAITALVSENGRFDVVIGERNLSACAGEAVSVFAFLPGTHVSSEGLEWALDGVELDELWKGTLNRATGERFTLRANRPLVVYRQLRS